MVSEPSEVFSVIFTAQLSKKCFGKKNIVCPKNVLDTQYCVQNSCVMGLVCVCAWF